MNPILCKKPCNLRKNFIDSLYSLWNICRNFIFVDKNSAQRNASTFNNKKTHDEWVVCVFLHNSCIAMLIWSNQIVISMPINVNYTLSNHFLLFTISVAYKNIFGELKNNITWLLDSLLIRETREKRRRRDVSETKNFSLWRNKLKPKIKQNYASDLLGKLSAERNDTEASENEVA